MTKRLILFVLFLPFLGRSTVQNSDALQVITAQNVSMLVEIAAFGEEDRNAQNTHVEFSPNGDYLIYDTTFQTAGSRLEGNIYVWQLEPLTHIATFLGSIQGFVDDTHSDFSYCLRNEMQYGFNFALEDIVSQIPTSWCGIIDPSGHVVATGEGYDFFLHLRDAKSGEILTSSEIPAIWRTFSHDGSLLATSSILNEIAIWDVSQILASGDIQVGDAMAVMPHQGITITAGGDVVFSPDDRYLAYSSVDGVFVWDIEAQTTIAELGDRMMSHSMAFSPDGTLMITTKNIGSRCAESLIIWDATTWEQIDEFEPFCVAEIAFHPEGTMLATANTQGEIQLWAVPVAQE